MSERQSVRFEVLVYAMALLGCVAISVAFKPRPAEAEPRPPIGGGVPAKAAAVKRPELGIVDRVKVVDVIDGDTIEVEVVHRVRVRLLDCWAPESRTLDLAEKKLGIAAKDRLTAIAEGRGATLFVPTGAAERMGDVTTLGRVLGHVWLDGDRVTLSARLVGEGLAATQKGGRLGE